jgi:hypothetical protein
LSLFWPSLEGFGRDLGESLVSLVASWVGALREDQCLMRNFCVYEGGHTLMTCLWRYLIF